MKKFAVCIISLLTLSCFLYSQSEEALDVLNLSKSKVVQIKVKGKKKEDLRVTNGFLIEEGKFVVANLHSLSSGASIVAETGDREKVEPSGGLIISKSSDLALILVRKKGFDFFNLANYSTVGPGEKIYIICIKDIKNPQILEGNIETIFNLPSDLTIYRLSISCEKVFDGAPVINSTGEVVGILNTIGEEDSSIAVSLNSLSSILSRQPINFTGEDFLSSSDLKLFHSVSLIHSQKLDRAFQILNELSTIETTNPFIQYYFGIIWEARNQKDKALKSFQKAIQLKTDFPEAYLKIGSIYEKSGEFEKAVESYKNALKVKAFPEVYYSLALLYEKIDKKDEAIEAYNNYISANPEFAHRAYSRLSILYRLTGKFKDSMEAAQKVLEKFPDDIEANYNFALSAEKIGELEKAVNAYLKLINIDRKRVQEYYNYAVSALTKAEKYSRIVEISKEFTRNFPSNSSGHLNLGIAYLKMDDCQNAVDALSKAVKLDPTNYTIHYNLGIAYVKLGKDDEAINCFKECLKIKQNDPSSLYNLGIISYRSGNLNEAINALDSYLKINPKDINAHLNIASAYLKTQNFDNAINQLKEALKIDSKNIQARYNLALSYFNKKDYKNAIDSFNSCLSLNPNDINILYNLALTYLIAGFYPEAIQTFKKVILLDPDNALAHYNLGYAYLLSKNKFGALEEYGKLQKLNPELAQKLRSYIDRFKE